MQKFLLGPTTWKVMQRNVWKDIANWRTKQLNSYTKVATPCIDDHQCKEEENESVGELSTVWSQIVLKCLYLAHIGRRDICGPQTNFPVPSQNRQKLVRNVWRV